MKKLMFAMAAVAAGAVFAGDEGIVSANIVGYAGNECDTDSGTVLMTPQFVNVGAETGLKIGDLKPVPSDSEYTLSNGDVDIQFLDNGGCTIDDKWYIWNAKSGKFVYKKGTKKGQDASAEVIPAGVGVSVGCGVDPKEAVITLQGAGQVGNNDALVELDTDSGTVLAGNPFPVDVTIGDLVLELNEGSEYTLANGDVDIQFLDNGGCTIEDKWYIWNAKSGKFVYKKGTKKGQDASAEVIKAGEGVSVGCGVDPSDAVVTLRIPAPEL